MRRSGLRHGALIPLCLGEHVFPPYTYNSRLCFVTKGKLYISTNHVMNPDYSDDVLSFQMFELVDKAGGIR